MSKMKLDVANQILCKYGLELRYSKYDIHSCSEAELIKKDSNRNVSDRIDINIQRNEMLSFYVSSINLYSCNYDSAEKHHIQITKLYSDIDKLNELKLPLRKEKENE